MDRGSPRVGPSTALAAMIVLAGCSGAVGPPGTPTSSVTPAPVPQDATPAAGRTATGLSPDGVTNASLLAASHRRSLSDTSFTERTVTTIRDENGTLLGSRTLVVKRDSERFRVQFELEGEFRPESPAEGAAAVDVWSDGETTTQSVTASDGSVRRELVTHTFYASLADPGAESYAQVLEREALRRVDRRVENGTTLYVFVADSIDSLETFGLTDTTHTDSASLRAVVGDDGVVRRVVVTFAAEDGGRSVIVEHVFETERIGTTTTPPPPWHDEAVASGTPTPGVRAEG